MFSLKTQPQELSLGDSSQVQCRRPPAGENATPPDLSRGTLFLEKSEREMMGCGESACSLRRQDSRLQLFGSSEGVSRHPRFLGQAGTAAKPRITGLGPFPASGLLPGREGRGRGEGLGRSFPQGRVQRVPPRARAARARPDSGRFSCPSGRKLLLG